MKITQKNEDGKLTIELEGWLDNTSAPQLGEVVDAIADVKEVILDFAQVEYISSAGIRQLVSAHRKAKEIEANLQIIHVNSEVMSILSMTGIDKKMNFS